METDIKRLLGSALEPVFASHSFKHNLLQLLKQEVARIRKDIPEQHHDTLARDGNLSSLMTSSTMPVNAVPAFRDRLLYQLVTSREEDQRKRHWRPLALALSTVAVVVMLLGMVAYPYFWAPSGLSLTARIDRGIVVITQTKPWLFSWGSRIVHHNLTRGDCISLAAGDRIATNADTLVVLTLFNESSVKIYPNSEVVINALQARDAKGLYLVRLMLNSGMATSSVTGINYELETPVAAASVLGTDFRVEIITNDQTNLATNKGTVRVGMEGNTVHVAAGEEVQAIRGQPLIVTSQSSPAIGITAYGIGNTIVWPSIVTSKRLPPVTIEQPAGPEVTSSSLTISGRTDPEATVTINGSPIPVDIYGVFYITMDLKPGATEITIAATGRGGKTTTVTLVLSLPETR